MKGKHENYKKYFAVTQNNYAIIIVTLATITVIITITSCYYRTVPSALWEKLSGFLILFAYSICIFQFQYFLLCAFVSYSMVFCN